MKTKYSHIHHYEFIYMSILKGIESISSKSDNSIPVLSLIIPLKKHHEYKVLCHIKTLFCFPFISRLQDYIHLLN